MIENRGELSDHGSEALRTALLDVCEGALERVHPRTTVPAHVERDGDVLRVDGERYDLDEVDDVYVLGAGKGSAAVVAVLREVLGDRLTEGVVVEKRGQGRAIPDVAVHEAGHPLPDEAGRDATRRVLAVADAAGADDLVIACITGGASALLVAPADPVSLKDVASLTGAMLDGGLPIEEVNAVRKHVSDVKGGRLAERIRPATCVSLVVVDEVAGEPWGPTVPDPTTFADAIDVLERRELWDRTPGPIRRRLVQGRRASAAETPTEDDLGAGPGTAVVLADGTDAPEAAAARAGALGYGTAILSTVIEGESREVGTVLAGIAKEIRRHDRPVEAPCIVVSGGETTVTVDDGPAGRGGPNQELALQFGIEVDGVEGVALLALGTDGTDGPTDVAGGLVDGGTASRARDRGIDPFEHVTGHDSTTALEALDEAVYTGATGTNVMDLRLLAVG